MKNLLPFCLFGVLVVLSSCNPILYQPNTINAPTVDTIKTNEIKLQVSPRVFDVQINKLTPKKQVVQLSFAQSFHRTRYGLGLGKMNFNGHKQIFSGLNLSFSQCYDLHFEFTDFYYQELSPEWGSKVYMNANQIHISGTKTWINNKFLNRTWLTSTSSLFLEVNWIPNFFSYYEKYDGHNDMSITSNYLSSKHNLFAIIAFQQQFPITKNLSFTIGSKVPISLYMPLRDRGLSANPISNNFIKHTYFTTELVYFRVGWKIKVK